MTNKIPISIITITLNNHEGLKNTHESLIDQTFQNYEWIVIDGESTDGTVKYLETTNAVWISEKDAGIYDAMNKGIERANGEYLLFLNSGDYLSDPGILQIIRDVIREENPDFIYGDSFELIRDAKQYKKARPYTKMDEGMITHHQAMLYKKSLFKDLKYNTDYKIAADYDLTLKVFQEADTIYYLTDPICIFVGGGISQKQVMQGRIEQLKIRHNRGIPIHKNIATFLLQSGAYFLRRFFPHIYWHLKRD